MDPHRALSELAGATSALVEDHDVAGTLLGLVHRGRQAFGADASGILAAPAGDALQVLASSGPASSDLELLQSLVDEGPCVDAHTQGAPAAAGSAGQAVERWPVFGPRMAAAGYAAVHSAPVRWAGRPLGAMALFWAEPRTFTPAEHAAAQAFADVAALVVVQRDPVVVDRAGEAVREALAGRALIEMARGVLAVRHETDVDEAQRLLVTLAERDGLTLTALAARLVGARGA